MATRQQILWVQILRVRNLQMLRVLVDAFSAHFMLMLWLARLADIRQAVLRGLSRLDNIRRAVMRGLTRLADICQAVLRGLARLAKGKIGEFYANLASLASLANLASVG
jgi:hypothetical protein